MSPVLSALFSVRSVAAITAILLLGFLICALPRLGAAARHFTALASLLAAASVPVISPFLPALGFTLPGNRLSEYAASLPRAWVSSQFALQFSLVSAFLAVRVLLGIGRILQIRRRAQPVTSPSVMEAWERSRLQTPTATHVRLLTSRDIEVPCSWGIIDPVVMIPSALNDDPAGSIESILVHELNHAGRSDCMTRLVVRAVEIIYWWHPLVWILSRMSELESERACDDAVLLAGHSPTRYADVLVAFGTVRAPSLAAGAGGNLLEPRIRSIVDSRRQRRPLDLSLAILLLVPFGIAAAAGIAMQQPSASSTARQSAKPPVASVPSPAGTAKSSW